MSSYISENDIEAMFQALHEPRKPRVAPVKYQQLQPLENFVVSRREIDYLGDVGLTIDVELGSTQMSVREILDLDEGMVVELDCLAGEPVHISLNGSPFARGEVVVLSEYFGVRVSELVHSEDKTEHNEE